MDSIPLSSNKREANPDLNEMQCSSCKVIGDAIKMFGKGWSSSGDELYFQTCKTCRDKKRNKREELRISKLPVRPGCSYSRYREPSVD